MGEDVPAELARALEDAPARYAEKVALAGARSVLVSGPGCHGASCHSNTVKLEHHSP